MRYYFVLTFLKLQSTLKLECVSNVHGFKIELNTEKEGCMSYTAPEDAQRPRAVYDICPDF